MGKLREPVSWRTVFLVFSAPIGLVVGIGIAAASPSTLKNVNVPALTASFVFSGLILRHVDTLIHELGHGLVAVSLTGRAAKVVVGRPPRRSMTLGRLTVEFGLVPFSPPAINGVLRMPLWGLPWRTIGWIALAGPAANLLEALVLVSVWTLVPSYEVMLRYLLVVWVLQLIVQVVHNLRNAPSRGRGGVVGEAGTKRDGWLARQAFARHRIGAPLLQRRTATPGTPSVPPPPTAHGHALGDGQLTLFSPNPSTGGTGQV